MSTSSLWETRIPELCSLIIQNHYSKCLRFFLKKNLCFLFGCWSQIFFFLSVNYPLGWITDQPSCRPVTKQLLSVAICSGWKEWEASRPCHLAYWIWYLLLEERTMWHFRYGMELFYGKKPYNVNNALDPTIFSAGGKGRRRRLWPPHKKLCLASWDLHGQMPCGLQSVA